MSFLSVFNMADINFSQGRIKNFVIFISISAIILAAFNVYNSRFRLPTPKSEKESSQSQSSRQPQSGSLSESMPKFPVLYRSRGVLEAEVIYDEPSIYGKVTVFDYRGYIRALMIDGVTQGTWNFYKSISATYTHDISLFLEIYSRLYKGRDILIIGLGGGGLLKELKGSDFKIDVAEIDPKVVKAAKKFFLLPDNLSYEIFVDDGRHFLRKTDKKYDIIIFDLCDIFDSNAHLWTKEAFQLAKAKLKTKDSVFIAALNVFRGGDKHHLDGMVANTLGENFKNLYFTDPSIKINPNEFTVVDFFASDTPVNLSFFSQNISIEKWKFDKSYPGIRDDDISKIVKYYFPVAEELRKQTVKNFGFSFISPK